ncbi:MAG: rRNA maturation RNase YbeY [Acidimicrobiia bacterium]
MDIQLIDEQDDPLEPKSIVALAESVLVGERLPPETEVAIKVVDKTAMAVYNETAMAVAGPTDVLAFPIEDAVPGTPPRRSPQGPPVSLGDVVVCPEVVRANAQAAGVAFEDELALMVVHGLLHLLGYDHVEDAEAQQMEDRERALLEAAGRVRP